MCSSVKGSNKRTANKPRTLGLFASMSADTRSSFAAVANAADERRHQLVLAKASAATAISATNKQTVRVTWFNKISSFFY